jgi:tetratricopeptide (TPR) repeat protein
MSPRKLGYYASLIGFIIVGFFLVKSNWKTANHVPEQIEEGPDDPGEAMEIEEVILYELSHAGVLLGVDFPLFDQLQQDSLFIWETMALEKGLVSLAGYYAEKAAESLNSDSMRLLSSRYYIFASGVSDENTHRRVYLKQAGQLLQEYLQVNEGDLDAKSLLGYVYVRTEPAPMKGIGLLQEILSSHPDHEQTLQMLGNFSIESGQFEKALERFKKLLSLHPQNADYYFKLSEVFGKMNEKDSASHYLDKGVSIRKGGF